jgi:dihydroorotate dehydrogenase electron transfer subunit
MPITSLPSASNSAISARVVANNCVQHNEFELIIEAPSIAAAALPGQFVMVVTGEGFGFEHRRPFSLFRADPDTGLISILYLARGSFTRDLAQKAAGDEISLLGPIGTHFDTKGSERVAIVASGGIGAPPLCFLVRRLTELPQEWRPAMIIAICGARNADLLVGIGELESLGAEVHVVTDDGSAGEQGNVPEYLERLLRTHPEAEAAGVRVYGCGPMPMLRALTLVCERHNAAGEISIEAPMHCGVGACDSCLIPVMGADGTHSVRACVDGPVLAIGQYQWPVEATP